MTDIPTPRLEALREAVAWELFDDTPNDKHGQLCPIWTRRPERLRKNETDPLWTDCDCWQLRRVRHLADIALGAPALRSALASVPTPDEVDALLARLSGTGYASECVEIVEDWIEERFGVVGAFTANERANAEYTVGVTVRSSKSGPDGTWIETSATYANEDEATTAITDAMIADLHEVRGMSALVPCFYPDPADHDELPEEFPEWRPASGLCSHDFCIEGRRYGRVVTRSYSRAELLEMNADLELVRSETGGRGFHA